MSIGDDDLGRPKSGEEGGSRSCLMMGIIVGGVGGFVLVCGGCCIGSFYFRANSIADDVAADLQGNPVIVQNLGEIESLEADFGSLIPTGEEYAFRVTGTTGSGSITARCVEDDEGVFHVLWGQLELGNGEVYDLFPDGRSDFAVASSADHERFWSDTFPQDVIDRLVKADLADHPAIVEHVGEIQRLASDVQMSMQEPGDIWVFDISGEKGRGFLRANCVLVADNEIDVDSGVLMLDSGEIVQLFPETPMDPLPDEEDAPSEPIEP